MSNTIPVEIAPGELIDKITILEIKLERIEDADKRANVKLEWDVLSASRNAHIAGSDALSTLSEALKKVNEQLWEIEDDIRACERASDFSDTFVQLARSVYITNDERARLKREINDLLGSSLVEEKSYEDY